MVWLDAMTDRLDRWSERVAYELFRLALYVTMPGLVILVTLDVALRYLFNAPLQWGRDVNGMEQTATIKTNFCAHLNNRLNQEIRPSEIEVSRSNPHSSDT